MSGNRSGYIGGSDIAAIVGLKPFGKTRYDVWLEKTGRVSGQAETGVLRRGKRLEPYVLEMIGEERGRLLTQGGMAIHPTLPWVAGHPDALIVDEKEIIEAKTASAWRAHEWGEEGTDEIPAHYLAQVAWYMAILSWDRATVGVLIGGEEFRAYHIQRDKALEEALLEEAQRFWKEQVETDIAPPLEASATVGRYLREHFPRDTGSVRPSSGNEDELVRSYLSARREADKAEDTKNTLEAQVKIAIGDDVGLEGEWGQITWKKAKDSVKVNWEMVARGMNPPPELVSLHSETRPGSRRLLVKAR